MAAKTCLFCGAPGGNTEHIIAEVLFKRMGAERMPISVAARGVDGIKERANLVFNTLVTKHVCEPCNIGWMSALEAWMDRNLGALLEDDAPKKMAPTWMEYALKEKDMLARWALKTAITADSNAPNKESFLEPCVAHDLYAGKLPISFLVEVGIIEEDDFFVHLERGLFIWDPDGSLRFKHHVSDTSMCMNLQFRHLGIRACIGPGAVPVLKITNGRMPLRCFPEAMDPHKIDFRFHHFKEFEESTRFR